MSSLYQNKYKDLIELNNLPEHIAVIMDGNGRWAKKQGKPRVFGHKNGVKAVREATEACAEIGIKYLTLYAFSTENWNRPSFEVTALMELLVLTIGREVKTLQKNNIRLNAIGNLSSLPSKTRIELEKAIEATKNNTRMTLTLALSYGSREEIFEAFLKMAQDFKDEKINLQELNPESIKNYLQTSQIPDPELLIRTSGECRVSNFLLWQIAYTEFIFTDKLWPEIGKEDFYSFIYQYQQRERRFGKTSEQINS
ncbi:MAG: isoprenyl transferase [Chitinophagales bacterium]|nr:isoprenyl transferase [Chitinophagales bacterium]MCZ2394141.1 isoprenyl transferase [Chitinophagales bacterium]